MSDSDGSTALHKAAESGRACFEVLLAEVKDQDLRQEMLRRKDKKGNTPKDVLEMRERR